MGAFPNLQIKDISWLSLMFGIAKMIDIQVAWSYMLYWGNNSFIQFTFAVLDMMDTSGKHNLKFLCSWSLHLQGEMGHEHKVFWHVDSTVRGIQEHWCLFLIWGFRMWSNTREGKRTWENHFYFKVSRFLEVIEKKLNPLCCSISRNMYPSRKSLDQESEFSTQRKDWF